MRESLDLHLHLHLSIYIYMLNSSLLWMIKIYQIVLFAFNDI